MFLKKSKREYKDVIEKIQMKTTVYGKKSLMAHFRLEKGALLPVHHHVHEQTGYLVSGLMDLTIGRETFRVESGDSWCIPGNTDHGAEAIEDSVAVEVFSPVREDYLP